MAALASKLIAELIYKVIKGLSVNKTDNSKIEKEVKKEWPAKKREKKFLAAKAEKSETGPLFISTLSFLWLNSPIVNDKTREKPNSKVTPVPIR